MPAQRPQAYANSCTFMFILNALNRGSPWNFVTIVGVKKVEFWLYQTVEVFLDRTKETILPLCKSLIRLYLEYCNQIWSPYHGR